ncbi:hypothetical protein [Mycobacterium sp. 236(2023)]|uniref:hypothetical protein n=1 Tax=Mycobacterium sp. 236(2023) TaxID=3038163 RepID=UPI002414D35E|nr:hypothetical protein [Mycobacterium sp. 236(2023)]MDG4667316.1 hypothetical protein [Mycobacterium sp. 236(2023)]
MTDGAGPVDDPDIDDRVRRELAHLDADSAPEAPADVVARIGAALRDAPHPSTAHALPRPTLTRPQRIGLIAGIAAIGTAAVVSVLTLTRDPAPTFPAEATASQITVERPGFPVSDDELRAAVGAPTDLGPLTDPQRRASCLAGLGYAPTLEPLGGRQLEVSGRPGVLLLLPGETPDQIDAVAVEPGCSAVHAGRLAETVIDR